VADLRSTATLIVQEATSEARVIGEFGRRVENLAWTLHAHHNRQLLSAILVVSGHLDLQMGAKLQSRLSRFCKLIIVPSSAGPSQLLGHLASLNRNLGLPVPSRSAIRDQSVAIRDIISSNPLQRELHIIQEQCGTPDEVCNALQNELQRRVMLVLNAIA